MTQAEIMKKRDELAESYTWPNWPKKSDYDRSERYSTMMQYEIGYVVNEAFEEGFSAAIQLMLEREKILREALKLSIQKDGCACDAESIDGHHLYVCYKHEALAEVEEWKP